MSCSLGWGGRGDYGRTTSRAWDVVCFAAMQLFGGDEPLAVVGVVGDCEAIAEEVAAETEHVGERLLGDVSVRVEYVALQRSKEKMQVPLTGYVGQTCRTH